jgi:HEPN domain-containing protein
VTADVMARGYLALALARSNALPVFLAGGSWPTVVREAQEAVELYLKGALRWVGVEPTRTHDPGVLLRSHAAAFPDWFQPHIDDLAFISGSLAGDRGASFYGDERRGIPPDQLFDRADAERAIEQVGFVRGLCERLMA